MVGAGPGAGHGQSVLCRGRAGGVDVFTPVRTDWIVTGVCCAAFGFSGVPRNPGATIHVRDVSGCDRLCRVRNCPQMPGWPVLFLLSLAPHDPATADQSASVADARNEQCLAVVLN